MAEELQVQMLPVPEVTRGKNKYPKTMVPVVDLRARIDMQLAFFQENAVGLSDENAAANQLQINQLQLHLKLVNQQLAPYEQDE